MPSSLGDIPLTRVSAYAATQGIRARAAAVTSSMIDIPYFEIHSATVSLPCAAPLSYSRKFAGGPSLPRSARSAPSEPSSMVPAFGHREDGSMPAAARHAPSCCLKTSAFSCVRFAERFASQAACPLSACPAMRTSL